MPKTILSIDLGTAWAKLLKTQSGLRSEAILDYRLIGIHSGDTFDSIAAKVQSVIEENEMFADQNLLAVSSRNALYQELTFPFTQQGKIKQVLPFELEANLPVNISDYVWDYFLAKTGNKQSKAFCVLQEKSYLREWINAFAQAGTTIHRIDLDLTAYAGFAGLVGNKEGESAFLDLGWSKINLAIVQNSQLQIMRTIPVGIGDILQDAGVQTDAEQTQVIENTFSQLLTSENQDSDLPASYRELIKQIKLCFMQLDLTDDQTNIYSTGGGASLPSFCKMISRDSGLEFSSRGLPLPDSLKVREEGTTEILFTTLALHGTQQKSGMNLRQGDLALHEHEPLWKPHLRYAAVALVLILSAWGFSYGSNVYFQKQKLDKLQKQMEKTFREVVPGARENIKPIQYPSIIKSRINALQSGSVTKDVPPVKTTMLLSAISKSLPEDLQLQIELFSLDGSTLNLSGSAADYKTVDQIKNHLKKLKYLSEVEIVGANVNQGGKKVSFNIRSSIQDK